MVGLPARGKTYISKKLTRYLNWIGVPTKGEAAAQAGAVTLGVHSACHDPHPPRKEWPFPLQLLKLSLRDHSRELCLQWGGHSFLSSMSPTTLYCTPCCVHGSLCSLAALWFSLPCSFPSSALISSRKPPLTTPVCADLFLQTPPALVCDIPPLLS